jgi:hypothetical protein
LLALFQSYGAATSLIEDRDLTEAAHEARLATEAETARWSRWKLGAPFARRSPPVK